jgi:hypothetical protein
MLKTNKTPVNELTQGTRINPRIPATPRYGYAVCCGVPKCNTVPVPAVPVLEEPRVYPYPCGTLRMRTLYHATHSVLYFVQKNLRMYGKRKHEGTKSAHVIEKI